MADKRTTLVMMLRDEVSDAAKKIDKNLGGVTSNFKSSVLAGVGLGGGIAMWGLLQGAVSTAVGMLGDATRAAIDDEASQAKLTTAIDANAKGWDGNRAAIEEVLTTRMKLGFSDDEQRESLALLVAKTEDVTEALDIQRVAMDLARLKGIGLGEASKAIALGMEGQGRALKELGINVKDMTDKHAVLGAVQAKAAGQAEAWGDTAAGAVGAANVALDEAVETIGKELIPVVVGLAGVVRDEVVPAVYVLRDLARALDDVKVPGTDVGPLTNIFDVLQTPFHTPLWEALDGTTARLKLVSDEAMIGAGAWDTYAEKGAASRQPSEQAAAGVGEAADAAASLTAQLKEAAAAWDLLNGRIKDNDEFANLPDKITVAKGAAITASRELNEAIEAGNTVAIAAARIRLREAESELSALRREFARLRAEAGTPITGGGFVSPIVGAPTHRASGGPVMAGYSYLVGERGPELFVPGTSGGIVPNGGSVTLNVTVQGAALFDPYGQAAQQLAQAILPGLQREVARQGVGF